MLVWGQVLRDWARVGVLFISSRTCCAGPLPRPVLVGFSSELGPRGGRGFGQPGFITAPIRKPSGQFLFPFGGVSGFAGSRQGLLWAQTTSGIQSPVRTWIHGGGCTWTHVERCCRRFPFVPKSCWRRLYALVEEEGGKQRLQVRTRQAWREGVWGI